MSVQQKAPAIHAALLSNIGLGCEVHVRWTGVDLHISMLLQPCAVALLSSHIIKHPRNTTIVMLAICITTSNVLLHHTAAHCSDTERVKPRRFLNRRKQDRTQAVSIHCVHECAEATDLNGQRNCCRSFPPHSVCFSHQRTHICADRATII